MVPVEVTVRRGPTRFARAYLLMVRYNLTSLRSELAVILVVQLLTGAGMAVIYGFVLGDLDTRQAYYVATAAPTLALVPIGFSLLPSVIGQQKAEGTYDFVWSLPVPRSTTALASLTVFGVAALPGTAVALLAASMRFDLDLTVSPLIVPALLLTSLMAASVGFAVGHAVANPRVTNLITNLVMFLVLMFAPIAFPIEQFPDWLATVHRVLPFHHMAVVVRDSLTDGLVTGAGRSYLVLGAWTAASWAVTGRVVGRRR